jgi:hypothetical protein
MGRRALSLQLLATLLITRQVIGNVKESVVPYLKTQFQLAKMCCDVLGVADSAPSLPACDTDEADVGKKSDEPILENVTGVGQVQIESSAIPVSPSSCGNTSFIVCLGPRRGV